MNESLIPLAPEEGGFDTEYTVSWSIDLDASSPVEAARKALWYLMNETGARVFEVSDGSLRFDDTEQIDLWKEE